MESIRPLVEGIPGVINYELFQNGSKYVPEDVISIGVEINFKDVNALDIFLEHPKHYEANAVFEKYLADPPFMVLTHKVRVLKR